ncbi:MAG: 30S ribosomal protein S18 [SAR202 cluster bacterium]|nr:30S ribosomal protein S18 [SAR202 cluster bacterium]
MTTENQSSGTPAAPQRAGPGGPPRGGPGGPRRGGRPRFFARRKVCNFCVGHAKKIDYKESGMLWNYISDRTKIETRRKSGTCAKHQRMLAQAIKRARYLALLPASSTHFAGFRSHR